MSNTVGDHLNGLFCAELVKPFMNICLEFPLWSAVMVEHFSSPNQRASSAREEGYFSTLKASIITKNTRLRVDKFLVIHLRAISGDIKISESNNDYAFKDETAITLNLKSSQNNTVAMSTNTENTDDDYLSSNDSYELKTDRKLRKN